MRADRRRESALIIEALERLRETMPFALLALDTDNGSEFINEALLAFCRKYNIELTLSTLPEERPGMGGAKERIHRPPLGWLRSP
ncbi:MAG: hypothetical protein R3B13_38950 [Polyangiaceae bacterium]